MTQSFVAEVATLREPTDATPNSRESGYIAGTRILVISATVALCMLFAEGESARTDDRPNIVVVMVDDMGYSDIGCYGGEIDTPHIDALASNGLRFSQFYNCGRCCPTRASLLTGLYPHRTGLGFMTARDYGQPGYRAELNKKCVTIAEVLGEAGYSTYMSGKWHVCKDFAPDGPKHRFSANR